MKEIISIMEEARKKTDTFLSSLLDKAIETNNIMLAKSALYAGAEIEAKHFTKIMNFLFPEQGIPDISLQAAQREMLKSFIGAANTDEQKKVIFGEVTKYLQQEKFDAVKLFLQCGFKIAPEHQKMGSDLLDAAITNHTDPDFTKLALQAGAKVTSNHLKKVIDSLRDANFSFDRAVYAELKNIIKILIESAKYNKEEGEAAIRQVFRESIRQNRVWVAVLLVEDCKIKTNLEDFENVSEKFISNLETWKNTTTGLLLNQVQEAEKIKNLTTLGSGSRNGTGFFQPLSEDLVRKTIAMTCNNEVSEKEYNQHYINKSYSQKQ